MEFVPANMKLVVGENSKQRQMVLYDRRCKVIRLLSGVEVSPAAS